MTAKTAGAAKQYETEVDKPLGLALGQSPGGRVVITVRRYCALWDVTLGSLMQLFLNSAV